MKNSILKNNSKMHCQGRQGDISGLNIESLTKSPGIAYYESSITYFDD